MNFTQAVTSVLRKNYANFNGRASRAEFWWYALFVILIQFIFYALFVMMGGYEWLFSVYDSYINGTEPVRASGGIRFIAILYIIFALAIIVPNLAVLTRRYHDRGLSGWWVVGVVIGSGIPYLGFVVAIGNLINCALPGTEGDNNFGPKPAA